ncbi:MAG: hypothetical protein IKW81_12760 [Pseudobutyrivibrio sp.]|nr:hypothetical protein [Pseudobutyrivibrio sp.]
MKKFYKNPLIILVLGIIVIGASTVGATRAALTYQRIDSIQFKTAEIGVDLVGDIADGQLVFREIEQDIEVNGSVQLGKVYSSNVQVVNNSNTDTGYSEYVRVVVRKSWKSLNEDEELVKNPTLDPGLIKVYVDTEKGWIENRAERTEEQEVYYLTSPLGCGEAVDLLTGIKVDDLVTTVINNVGTETIIENEYVYDGQYVSVSLQVDAVQSHNTEDAIYGAWGVKVTSDKEDEGNIAIVGNSIP